MKVILGIDLSESYCKEACVTINKMYDVELAPTMYDPDTLLEIEPYYIVRCDDMRFRKFKHHFS